MLKLLLLAVLQACGIWPAAQHVQFLFGMYDHQHYFVNQLNWSLDVAIFPTECNKKEKEKRN